MTKPVKSKTAKKEDNTESDIEKLLQEKKKEWASITTQIHEINVKREQLEVEQKRLVKELTELMNKLERDPTTEGFTLDSATPKHATKSTSKPVKKEIISMDVESESETSEDESESESEDERPEILPKKGAGKKVPVVKTTKGASKALKLTKSDSNSESDEDSD